MWVPTSFKAKNFMAHIDSSFVFVNERAYMVYGRNLVDQGQESNGSGKSSLLEGICIALTGDPVRSDVTAKDLVRRGEKCLQVELILHNSITNEDLLIDRTIFSNTKSAILKVEVNGVVEENIIGVGDGTNTIFNKIGISRKDMFSYFLINKEKYKGGFLKMTDNDKKELIGRFSQANLIDPVYITLDKELSDLNASLGPLQTSRTQTQAKKELLQEQLSQLESTSEIDNRRKIRHNELIDQINHRKLVIENDLWSIHQIEDYQQVLFDEIEEINSRSRNNDVEALDKAQKQLQNMLDELDKEHSDANALKAKYANVLLGVIQCPQCNFQFVATDPSIDVNNAQHNHDEAIVILNEIQQDIHHENIELEKAKTTLKAARLIKEELENQVRSLQTQSRQCTQLISTLLTSVSSNRSQITELQSAIKVVLDFVVEDKSNSINTQISQYDVRLQTLNDDIAKIEIELSDKNKLYADFVKFRTHLSNTAIGVIEAQCNEYLLRMNSDLVLILEGYKINKNKQISEKITPSVTRAGMDIKFGTLSSGEKARIEVAIILSLQKLINANVQSGQGGLDLCFLDEIIESVDSLGMQGLMNSLDLLEQTIIVVTHGTFNKVYPNTIRVTKQRDELGRECSTIKYASEADE